MRVLGNLAGRGILLPDGAGDVRMSRTALPISRTASTAFRVDVWIMPTFWPISEVALAVCSAKALTS